jgi:hypothetical protein
MIIAKLTQPYTRTYYGDGFSTTTISGSYLVATTQYYVLGAPTSSFLCRIGGLETESGPDNVPVLRFKDFIRQGINLTSEELSNWGTDDTACLEAIATKLELEVEEYLDLEVSLAL